MIRDLHPHTRPQRTRDPGQVDERARALGYEPSDWPVRAIFKGLPALFALLGAGLALAAFVLAGLGPDRAGIPAEHALVQSRFPAPALQPDPAADLRRVEAGQRARLDRAPVPIEAAMDAVARHGWRDPGREGAR